MLYFTYLTKNLINGKLYAGVHKTNDLTDGYLGSGIGLKRAIKKYGFENFTRTILEYFSNDKEMFEAEKQLVNEDWVARKDTYNGKVGGVGGWDAVNNHPMHKEWASWARKGKTQKAWNKGRKGIFHHTEETKEKIGASKRGIPRPQHVHDILLKANKGRPLSEEHKRKLRESQLGKPKRRRG